MEHKHRYTSIDCRRAIANVFNGENGERAHKHTLMPPTWTACLSYRDMEFMAEGRELVPDDGLPLAEAPC